jgi:hypothetical protein
MFGSQNNIILQFNILLNYEFKRASEFCSKFQQFQKIN